MTTCDDGTERLDPALGEGVDPFVGGESPLLPEERRDDDGFTLTCEGDVHDICVRTLAAYLGSLTKEYKGRLHRLNRITAHQADPAGDGVPYPVAAVYAQGKAEGRYAGPPMAPHRITEALDTGDQFRPAWLYETATYMFDGLTVDLWFDDEVSRTALMMAIEEASSPYRGVGGFRLRMAGYYGAVAKFSLVGQSRYASPAEMAGNMWLATFRFAVAAPVIRVHTAPRATVRVQATVTG